ncbi:MAG: DUF2169 domain-containing protein [Polyangiaceae bacterium]|jgi:uncharacterized protein YjbI with pentapeptide repeats
MKVIKPNALGVLSRTYENGGQAFFSVAGLVFFAFGEGARLLTEQDLWKTVPGELGEEPLDLCMPKVRGEVLVNGNAYPYGGARPVCSIRMRVGSMIDKTLRVVGDRTWKSGVPTDPAPFSDMPVTYARAFGGPGFASNPTGKGFAPSRELPNVEDPRALVVAPRDRPKPAGFASIDFTWPQRASKAGTYDKKWQKTRYPGFPEDMDWTLFQAAPDDQWIEGFFSGDEAFSIEHMHPEKAVLDGKLPGVRVRVFVRFKGTDVLSEVSTRVDTVRLFPHLERGVMVARGLVKVAEDDAHDVGQLMLALETMGSEKPFEHYQGVLAARLEKKSGYLAALRESDLTPPRDPARKKDPAPGAELAPEGRLRKRMRVRQENARKDLVERLASLGVADAGSIVPELPAEPEVPELEDLGVIVGQLMEQAEQAKADAETKKVEADQAARASFASQGMDYDEEMKKAAAAAGGPPKYSAEAEIAKLAAMVRAARQAGIESTELEAQLADPTTLERMRRQEAQVREAYRRFAHQFPAATRLEGQEAARLRAEVDASLRERRPLARRDLTGADLAGIDLTGADLQGVLLEGANLAGAKLGGADLTAAVLARADLTGASLFAAKLPGANLGKAKLAGAELGSADLERATLAKADLSGAVLRDALLVGADLQETVLATADLSRARAAQAIFLKAELGTTRLAGAELTKAVFIECDMEGTDLTGANLSSATFVTVRGDGAVFTGANLTKASFVKDSRFADARFAGATLAECNLRGTVLERADFTGAVLERADLSEANLTKACLAKARAQGAQLLRADLTGADLTGIDLKDGSLSKACIAGANLTDANLFAVDFAKVRGDGETKLLGANVKRARVVGTRGVTP